MIVDQRAADAERTRAARAHAPTPGSGRAVVVVEVGYGCGCRETRAGTAYVRPVCRHHHAPLEVARALLGEAEPWAALTSATPAR